MKNLFTSSIIFMYYYIVIFGFGLQYPEKYNGFSLLDSLVKPGNDREKVKPDNDGLKKLSEPLEGKGKEVIGRLM